MASGLQMSVEEKGASKAALDVHRIGQRGSDVRPVDRKVYDICRRSTERRFQTRGMGAWPPLADATTERKQRENLDPRPLRATDALYRSLVESGAGKVEESAPTELKYGSSVPYARFHEYGSTEMPKRKLIELRPSERKQITDLMTRYVAEGKA